MTFLQKMTGFFRPSQSSDLSEIPVLPTKIYKIVVVDFQDNVESNSGENTVRLLREMENFEVSLFDEPFNKTFLNLESRTLFDLIDKGQTLLDRTMADVLIWGCRENNKIRLNFQTNKQYNQDDTSFVSLLDSLYLPAELFTDIQNFPAPLKTLLHGTIISAISPQDNQERIYRKYLLKKDITELSNDNSAKQFAINYMPFIMNFLGIIHLSCTYDNDDIGDLKISQDLFSAAIKHQDLIESPLHLGCIYYHLGQLYDSARQFISKHPSRFFKDAISNYRQAQRYLSKYTYPYDYGYICYKLSHLFFNYWKQKEDLQALRDSVSQLREVEKIFTPAQFPDFWADIQEDLGYRLSVLANLTRSADICRLAIACYRNRQKIMTEKRDPLAWAASQENIGDLYYKIGNAQNNQEILEDALECYHDALYLYENTNQSEKIKQLLTSITRTDIRLKNLG